MDANRVARGKARGISVALPQPKNSSITKKLSPFPTSSSIYSQRNCITNTNITMRKVIMNGPKKDLSVNESNFFNTTYALINYYL